MLKVGITGGIGSGKTTFCKVWEKQGAQVVYADDLAKQLMENDPELKKEIIRLFGPESFENDRLNRPYLAKKAFDEGMADALNKVVHPHVYKKISVLEKDAEKARIELFAVEAALLLNDGRPDGFDAVIVVSAPEDDRMQRIIKRDDVKQIQVKQRIKAQMPMERMEKMADLVVYNDGSQSKLEHKAVQIYRELVGK